MEALRAIRALGVAPRRTIRVVLFSGEEQGHYGSKAYVQAHQGDLANIQAVLVNDLGTGRTRGWALRGLEAARSYLARAIAPLNEVGVRELPLERGTDSDHWSFVEAGVPGFFAVQEVGDYFTATHHSQFDTFDRVKPTGSTSDTDVQRQLTALRQQIAALTASLSNGSAGTATGAGA